MIHAEWKMTHIRLSQVQDIVGFAVENAKKGERRIL